MGAVFRRVCAGRAGVRLASDLRPLARCPRALRIDGTVSLALGMRRCPLLLRPRPDPEDWAVVRFALERPAGGAMVIATAWKQAEAPVIPLEPKRAKRIYAEVSYLLYP